MKKSDFIEYVNKHFSEDDWSHDVCANRSLAIGEFSSNQTVCTRTLYNYVEQGLMDIRNCDLPEKLNRNTKIHRIRKNKRKLGRRKNVHKRSTIEKSSAIENATWF